LLIAQGSPLPSHDIQVPLLSLPSIFATTVTTIPPPADFPASDSARLGRWRDKIESLSGFKVGIAWQGSRKYLGDAHRSIPLRAFEPLATLGGVRLVSLQKGLGTEQLRELGPRWNVLDLGDRLDGEAAFVDSAAIMMSLDLVVTSDTSVAHLVGAMGCPVWIMLGFAPDWRFAPDREQSTWYPSARLFRQSAPGDWAGVVERVRLALAALARSRR